MIETPRTDLIVALLRAERPLGSTAEILLFSGAAA